MLTIPANPVLLQAMMGLGMLLTIGCLVAAGLIVRILAILLLQRRNDPHRRQLLPQILWLAAVILLMLLLIWMNSGPQIAN